MRSESGCPQLVHPRNHTHPDCLSWKSLAKARESHSQDPGLRVPVSGSNWRVVSVPENHWETISPRGPWQDRAACRPVGATGGDLPPTPGSLDPRSSPQGGGSCLRESLSLAVAIPLRHPLGRLLSCAHTKPVPSLEGALHLSLQIKVDMQIRKWLNAFLCRWRFQFWLFYFLHI